MPFYQSFERFYSESQIYEYIARNCYNVVFSTYLKIKCRGKTSIAVLYISGLLLHLELKIKKAVS